MFDFKPGEKHLINGGKLVALKLASDRLNLSYYLNSFSPHTKPDGDYRRNCDFLGFLEEFGSSCGHKAAGQSFVCVHIFEQNWDWELATKDGINGQSHPWVLFFQGCDDISYYKRFRTREELQEEWDETLTFTATDSHFIFN